MPFVRGGDCGCTCCAMPAASGAVVVGAMMMMMFFSTRMSVLSKGDSVQANQCSVREYSANYVACSQGDVQGQVQV